jgi:DNA gyrase subunit B
VQNNYNENSIKTLNYRESCRESLGMYIGSNDSKGMHHLLTEIVANAMDEAAAGYGKHITVTIDVDENRATIKDEGRGIPFKRNSSGNYAIIEMCTNLHSGGKFTGQGNYKSSLGLNGVGSTVTNALSTEFSIEVWRDDEHCLFQVFDGEYDDPIIDAAPKHKTGSIVSFIPDEKVFGNNKWDINVIKEELQLHALLNNNITFELIETEKEKVKSKVSYCYTNGIKDMLKIKTADLDMLTDPVYYSTTTENDDGETCDVEYAFAYSKRSYEDIYSFVNGGYTPHDGTHVTGFKTAYTSLINKLAKENDLIKDKNLSGDIIRKGLVLVLSIKMSTRPMFAEQTKLTLNSPSARALVSKAVGQLTLDKRATKQILDKIMIEQKAEEAAQRKREAQEKITKGGKNLNALRDLPDKLADASDFTDAEIFFCEGDSAAGGAKETKTPNQAIMPLRGKVKNCTSLELADAIKSDIIKDILNCLGCGIGEHFNINNLRYNRLIIMTDADADGKHIELLLMTLFLHHLPELVKAGKIYAATPPLYKTETAKEEKYWYEDSSEFKKYVRNHKNVVIKRFKGLGEMGADELYQTTMNPENRQLVQLTTEDMEKTLELYGQLMGKQASLRREFILKNKLSEAEDLFEDEEYEGE